MRYVGYSRGYHDGGLAIIEEDGTVSYASSSERYSKIKYDAMLAPELESMIRNDDYVVFFHDVKLGAEKYSSNIANNLNYSKIFETANGSKIPSTFT